MIATEMNLEPTPRFDLGRHVPHLLNRVTIATFALFEDRLKERGLVLGDWRILAALHQQTPLRVRDLVQRTGIEPPTVSRLLAGLESRGLVVRAPSGDDARGILVRSTSEGQALTADLVPHALAIEHEMLHGFTGDEIEFLLRLLGRIQTNILAASSIQR